MLKIVVANQARCGDLQFSRSNPFESKPHSCQLLLTIISLCDYHCSFLFRTSMFLLERLMISSDAFEVNVCSECGVNGKNTR